MSTPQPLHCRGQAYALLAEQLPSLDTTRGLIRAAVAVAMHELEDADLTSVEARLDELAHQVRQRVHHDHPQALLAHAHEVLFEEEGFTGNREDYHNPRNSYLPVVLKTRRGIPITLAMIYKGVLERLGISVCGINAPVHFLAGVQISETDFADKGLMLVDPFHNGRVLLREEAYQQIEQLTGARLPRDPAMLEPASHRQWLLRLLQNLITSFDRLGRRDDLAAMIEMRELVESC